MMKSVRLHFVFLIILTSFLTACNSPKSAPSESIPETPTPTRTKVVNVDDANGCLNYLKGKNFYGGNVRLEYTYDGNAAVYNRQTNELVFTGYVEGGERYGNASRRIKVAATTGSEVLKLMLSEDGNLMDETDATMYKTTP